MTDTSHPLEPINGPDLPGVPRSADSSTPQNSYAVQEDDGLISCFCGYADDDGNTVACDQCNTWQHISCYYPDLASGILPDDIQHFCVNCRPRIVDRASARHHQKQKQEQQQQQQHESLANGIKRTANKGHKKKIKDPNAPLTNGWPLDKSRHDRNSDSPREQPPPAKRPRTGHRHSDSTASTKGHSRKRNVSVVHHRRSPSRSPEAAVDKYSEEFLRCHIEDEWTTTDANLYNSIAVTNELSAWLSTPDEEFQKRYGPQKHEVFNRWDGDLDDIPGRPEINIVEDRDDTVRFGNHHPTWKALTVQVPIANGGYIGELKGHVGFKQEYQADPSNRWSQLRHPEPFVFFHPKLPIYIDARNEGTNLRYIRRSCVPNARLQILVTDQTDYHFCFMATKQIDPGVEVSVAWDTADGLPELVSRSLSQEHMTILSVWVSTVLANCGPCACQLPEPECLMSRFDRRVRERIEEAHAARMPKSKKRKTGQHMSPLNTTAINSRSGSEARKLDAEDDGTDSRSASGSAGRGSASRDITPHTHYFANGLPGTTEMSERERKKLAKEEEMFRRQEEAQTGRQAKKKRNSGGSALSTPSAGLSKPFVFPTGSTAKDGSRQSGNTSRSSAGRKSRSTKTATRGTGRAPKPIKPIYVDAATQCDMDVEAVSRPTSANGPKRKYISTRQHLLDLCARNRRTVQLQSGGIVNGNQANLVKTEQHASSLAVQGDANDADMLNAGGALQGPDTRMDDVLPGKSSQPSSPLDQQAIPAAMPNTGATVAPASSANPPAPPWPAAAQEPPGHHKPVDMHLQMPPPFTAPAPLLSAGSSIAQSPASLVGPSPPLFSPSVTAALATASPAKKKLSLSDYTRRNKANKDNKENEAKVERESSPASVVTNAAGAPGAEEAETKMEDVVAASSAAGT